MTVLADDDDDDDDDVDGTCTQNEENAARPRSRTEMAWPTTKSLAVRRIELLLSRVRDPHFHHGASCLPMTTPL